jgi:hypothetical protein
MWKTIPLCMWSIWREILGALKTMRTVAELEAFFLYIIFQWMVVYDCFHNFSFHDFLNLFSFFDSVFLLYISCVLGCAL